METTQQIQLEDLVPHETQVKLRMLTQPLTVRACVLADDAWAMKKFKKGIESVLQSPKLEDLVAIFYRLLDDNSKSQFLSREVPTIDDDGIKSTILLGGADLLMHCISGGDEVTKIGRAIMESVGFSRPMLDEAQKELLKKKTTPVRERAGHGYSTFSATSTDGQPSMSSAEHSERSTGAFKPSLKETKNA